MWALTIIRVNTAGDVHAVHAVPLLNMIEYAERLQ